MDLPSQLLWSQSGHGWKPDRSNDQSEQQGIKTMTVSGSAQTAAATDRIYIVLVFKAQTFLEDDQAQYKADQQIDTPLAGGGSPPTPIFPQVPENPTRVRSKAIPY